MNTKYPDSQSEFVPDSSHTTLRRPATFRVIPCDQPDYWTALISAFLVVCLLTALAMCSWQVGGGQNTPTVDAQPTAVASQGFSVNGQHTF